MTGLNRESRGEQSPEGLESSWGLDDRPGGRLDEELQRRVAERAYALSESEFGGTPEENWLRAEREILSQLEGASEARAGGG